MAPFLWPTVYIIIGNCTHESYCYVLGNFRVTDFLLSQRGGMSSYLPIPKRKRRINYSLQITFLFSCVIAAETNHVLLAIAIAVPIN